MRFGVRLRVWWRERDRREIKWRSGDATGIDWVPAAPYVHVYTARVHRPPALAASQTCGCERRDTPGVALGDCGTR